MCKYAILTEEKYIKNKKIDYRFYLILLKETIIDNKNLNSNYRILNTSTFFEESKIEDLLNKMNIKKRTFNKGINDFLKTDLVKINNDDILLKIKSKENSYYQLLNQKEIDKLIELSNTDIKIYLIIKYLTQYDNRGYIKLKTISEKIGFNSTNNNAVLRSINNLKNKNLINFNIETSKDISSGKLIKIKKYFFRTVT